MHQEIDTLVSDGDVLYLPDWIAGHRGSYTVRTAYYTAEMNSPPHGLDRRQPTMPALSPETTRPRGQVANPELYPDLIEIETAGRTERYRIEIDHEYDPAVGIV